MKEKVTKAGIDLKLLITNFLFLGLLISSCISSVPTQDSSNVEPTEQSVKQTNTPPVAIETTLVSPTNATVLTTQIASPTALSAETRTPQPTLTPKEAKDYIHLLFRTNAECKLPCWWGFSPDHSSWDDIERFIAFVRGNTFSQEENGQYTSHSFQGINVVTEVGTISNYFEFWEKNGVVKIIRLNSYGFNDPSGFQELWALYSPRQLMVEYGVPTKVWLSSEADGMAGSNRRAGYFLWMIYEDQGILAIYTGATAFEPVYHFCPEFDNVGQLESVDFYLQAPENPISIEENAQMMGLEIEPFPKVQTIEEATGLSVEQFYSLFIQSPPPVCFDTPQDIWP